MTRFENSKPGDWAHWWVEYDEPIACDLKALRAELEAAEQKEKES